MPELPEVESVRLSLLPHILGQQFHAVLTHRTDIIIGPTSPAALLTRQPITAINRRGKLLWLESASGRILAIHLGMSGQVLIEPADAPLLKHSHVVWTIAPTSPRAPRSRTVSPLRMVFRDPRRFGGLWTHASLAHLHTAQLNAMGPDALTITPERLYEAIHTSRRAIKPALLDQRTLAGVGNIYADEALFRSGIHPASRCHRLTLEHCTTLASAIRDILAASIIAGGSSLRDYVDAQGQQGLYAARHLVYGRGGLPCTRCSHTLRKSTLAQRTTVACPHCQRRV